MKKIISASRRTDIPRYFGRWLAHRRRAGFARFRNVFGGQGETSLAPRDVAGYLFWTKYAHPRLFLPQLRELLGEGVPCVFQFTATGYGRGLEPYIPRRDRVVDNMLALARLLPSPRCLQWRYDPIVVSEDLPPAWHLANFRALAARLEGATEVVNVSLVEPYLRAVRRMADPSARYRTLDPRRHSTVHRRYPDLGQAGDDVARLVAELRDVAAEHGMELRSCSNPELGLAASQCCGL